MCVCACHFLREVILNQTIHIGVRPSKLLSDYRSSCQTIHIVVRLSKLVSDYRSSCQTSHIVVRLSNLLSDYPNCCQTIQSVVRLSKLLSDYPNCCQTIQSVVRLSKLGTAGLNVEAADWTASEIVILGLGLWGKFDDIFRQAAFLCLLITRTIFIDDMYIYVYLLMKFCSTMTKLSFSRSPSGAYINITAYITARFIRSPYPTVQHLI